MLRNTVEKYSWWLAVVACFTLVTIDLVGALVTPGYDFWRDTVSHQMRPDASYSNFMRAALLSYGLLLVPFALKAGKLFRPTGWWRAYVVTGIWLHIALMAAAALFQNDSSASIFGLVTVNTVHDMGTIALFSAAMLTLLVVALSAGSPRGIWRAVHSRTSLLMVVSMLAVLLVAAITEFHGITERVNTAVFMGWIVTTARIKS